jgi:hypothetical protein
MPRTLAWPLAIPIILGTAIADASPPQQSQGVAQPPATSGTSRAVPAGEVMLPPLPFARMPDTSMPKDPPLAPLPDTAKQQH